jgi:hypothetical protein
MMFERIGINRLGLQLILLVMTFITCLPVYAQSVSERIVSVTLPGALRQQGVLSVYGENPKPEKLLVIVSGHPGVTRPYIDQAGKIQTKQNGNFLVRSRQFMISNKVALLLLDCRSDFVDMCDDQYQASAQRAQDVLTLVASVKDLYPTIREVWAVSTSRGAVSTAGFLKHAEKSFSGVIHTASTFSKATDQGLDFGPYINTPQFLVHHKDDPCGLTLYRDAYMTAAKWKIPLITVEGGSGFRGQKCQAFTQHGFAGMEAQTGAAILFLVENGQPKSLLIK